MERTPALTIVHFNDVYEITEGAREPIGGAARFQALLKSLRAAHPNLLVLFSGDAFSPSVMSSVSGGKHMVDILNEIGIHSATLGNHDFDFGIEACEILSRSTHCFPWMMANVLDGEGKLIAGGLYTAYNWCV